MIFKYFHKAPAIILTSLLLCSCLRSNNDPTEYPHDPQIYSFSLSAKKDTAKLLSNTSFTIDQVNGVIFNRKPLPYQFRVDSAAMQLRSSNIYYSFSQVILKLIPDSTYLWRGSSDSIPLNRLHQIITTAPDGNKTKSYTFELHVYKQDPYILSWEEITKDYRPLSLPVAAQKTLILGDRFFTCYRSGSDIKAITSSVSDGKTWTEIPVTGLPGTADLSTLTAAWDNLYMLDTEKRLFHSSEGSHWQQVATPLTVTALYGSLPSTEKKELLVAVTQNGTARFAKTADFTEMKLLNVIPEDIPVKDFSVARVIASSSYAVRFILLAGGSRMDGSASDEIFILQEKGGIIAHIVSRRPNRTSLAGSTLFFYDDRPYLMTSVPTGKDHPETKNILMYSDNFGMDWIVAKENQAFPAEFDVRTHASIITDADHHIWIFGGISHAQEQLTDVWRAKLNKFSMP